MDEGFPLSLGLRRRSLSGAAIIQNSVRVRDKLVIIRATVMSLDPIYIRH